MTRLLCITEHPIRKHKQSISIGAKVDLSDPEKVIQEIQKDIYRMTT